MESARSKPRKEKYNANILVSIKRDINRHTERKRHRQREAKTDGGKNKLSIKRLKKFKRLRQSEQRKQLKQSKTLKTVEKV